MQLLIVSLFFSFVQADMSAAESYIKKLKSNKSYSIQIKNLQTNELVNWQAEKKMTPASLTKLAILSALKEHYPWDWKFKSYLFGKSAVKGSVLEGGICFKASGDPSLVSEKMWVLVNNLTRKNIKKIRGGVYIDTSIHNDAKKDAGRSQSKSARAYNAPISAASFNWNSVNIYVQPTTMNKKAKVYLDPKSDYFVLTNKIKTVKGRVKNLKHGIHQSRTFKDGKEYLTLSGKIGIENEEELIFRNVSHPVKWFGHNLIAFMKQRGIEVEGEIQEKSCADHKTLLSEIESKDLYLIYRDMMKYSNNFITELLVKSMLTTKGETGSIAKAKEVIEKHLHSLGIKEFQLESVSGLSYQNRFSANDMNLILKDLIKDPNSIELLSTLPLAGLDGTLKSRFEFLGDNESFRAKTGLLSNAVALSGVYDQEKTRYLISMIYNGKSIYRARQEMQEIVKRLRK